MVHCTRGFQRKVRRQNPVFSPFSAIRMFSGEYCPGIGGEVIEWKISVRMKIVTQVASIFGMMRDTGCCGRKKLELFLYF